MGNKLCHILVQLYSIGTKQFKRLQRRYQRWRRRRFYNKMEKSFGLASNEIRFIDASDITTVTVCTNASDCDKYDTLRSVKSIRSNGRITLGGDSFRRADARKTIKEFRLDIEPETISYSIPNNSSSEDDSEEEADADGRNGSDKQGAGGSEDTPDLPLWICFALIFILLVSITVHIHEFEHMAYGYSFYYCLLFFIMQEYEVRDFRNTIFTFSLLLTGLAIISTTINAVILNIQNLVNRAKNRLPEEIRRRKEAAAAAGNPDAVIDPEEVLKELLAQEGGVFTRSVMPKSTIENLEDIVEATVQEVEQEMEEEAAAEREALTRIPEILGVDVSTLTETKRYVNVAAGPNIPADRIWKDSGTNPCLDVMSEYTATDLLERLVCKKHLLDKA